MHPLVRDQAIVEISQRSFYLPGDIICFEHRSKRYTLHRIIGFHPTRMQYVTQADNAITWDGTVPRHSIVGRLSGGDCEKDAISPPLRHRILAIRRFLHQLSSKFGRVAS